jgi:hypothetical protein
MQPNHATRSKVIQISALFLCAIGAGVLFPACGNSGSGNTTTGTGGATTGGMSGTPAVLLPRAVPSARAARSPLVEPSAPVVARVRVEQPNRQPGEAPATFQMENLDRGVVAVKVSGGVYVGWRMFGYEYDTTASDVTYNLYKDGAKVANVTDSTNYLDASGTASSKYTVTAVIKGTEGPQSPAATPWAQQYLSIPLTPPSRDEYGIVQPQRWSPRGSRWRRQTRHRAQVGPVGLERQFPVGRHSDVYIDGYTLAGTKLWRIDLGPNIRAGAHYTQMSVYDFDGDGKAELACQDRTGNQGWNRRLSEHGTGCWRRQQR